MSNKVKITGTFIDEITDDIPSQNWGETEWDREFKTIKEYGFKRLFMIRAGLDRFLAYPSNVIPKKRPVMPVYNDLLGLFMTLAEKNGLELWPGNYVGRIPDVGYYNDLEFDKQVALELWERYGKSPAFKGWYFSKEIGKYDKEAVAIFRELAIYCKKISGNLPILISPWISHSPKAARNAGGKIAEWQEYPFDFEAFFQTWDETLKQLSGAVDIIAWQDGGVNYPHLPKLLALQQELGKKHSIKVWMNAETFDRDMPFRFPPLKWDRLRYKLECAQYAGIEEVITFEFSHFMSPNSMWQSAKNLGKRYLEYINEKQ